MLSLSQFDKTASSFADSFKRLHDAQNLSDDEEIVALEMEAITMDRQSRCVSNGKYQSQASNNKDDDYDNNSWMTQLQCNYKQNRWNNGEHLEDDENADEQNTKNCNHLGNNSKNKQRRSGVYVCINDHKQ